MPAQTNESQPPYTRWPRSAAVHPAERPRPRRVRFVPSSVLIRVRIVVRGFLSKLAASLLSQRLADLWHRCVYANVFVFFHCIMPCVSCIIVLHCGICCFPLWSCKAKRAAAVRQPSAVRRRRRHRSAAAVVPRRVVMMPRSRHRTSMFLGPSGVCGHSI